MRAARPVLKICTLLDKYERREVDVTLDYVGNTSRMNTCLATGWIWMNCIAICRLSGACGTKQDA